MHQLPCSAAALGFFTVTQQTSFYTLVHTQVCEFVKEGEATLFSKTLLNCKIASASNDGLLKVQWLYLIVAVFSAVITEARDC